MKAQGILCVAYDGTSLHRCRFSKSLLEELVLALIQLVPMGRVTTYSSIARLLNIHPRSVAQILRKNRKPVIYPCHRVVRSNGHIGGYTLRGRRADNIKRKLLILEGIPLVNDSVPPRYVLNITKWLLEDG